MRITLLSVMLVVFGLSSHAQLSLQPMIGFQNSQTCLKYNDQKGFSPMGHVTSPQMSLRMDYLFKKGHGPFIGINTSNTGVEYNFSDPATGMKTFNTSKGNYRIGISGGYSFITKPIYFNKSKANNSKTMEKKEMQEKHIVMLKKSCGSFTKEVRSYSSTRSHCSSKNKKPAEAVSKKPAENIIREVMIIRSPKKQNNSWFMQVQPSAGLAFVPGVSNGIERGTMNGVDNYKYTAGDYSTALVTGANFIFGKNRDQKFSLNLNYFTGLGNLNTKSITIEEAGKTTTTNLRSSASGWSLGVGVPIQLTKRKVQKLNIIEQKLMYKKQCERSYKSGCGKKS